MHAQLRRASKATPRRASEGAANDGVAGESQPVSRSETGAEEDEGGPCADRNFALVTLRFLFFDLTPPDYLLELLLERLCCDVSYLSELDALVTLAESAGHKARVSLQTYALLVKRSYKMLAQRCSTRAKKALLEGGGSTYLEPLSATFHSADSVHRRIHVLFASAWTLETWISALETCTSRPEHPMSAHRGSQPSATTAKTRGGAGGSANAGSCDSLNALSAAAKEEDAVATGRLRRKQIKEQQKIKRIWETAGLLSSGQAHEALATARRILSTLQQHRRLCAPAASGGAGNGGC